MAGKPREHQAQYKGRIVRTDSKEDLEFLYVEERLSSNEIREIFNTSNDTILRRMKKFGIEARDFKGENNFFWNGGRKVDKGGYILVKCSNHPYANSDGYVREHRLVMEKKLGRYLDPDEVVHHIDKNRQNNSPENLALMESNSAHAKLENNFRLRDELGRYT